MATLTGMIPDLYAALNTVSRELVGFIPSVSLDANAARAAVGQTVVSFKAPAVTASDVTAQINTLEGNSQTAGSSSVTITKSRKVPITWTGEEQLGVSQGPGYLSMRAQQFAQAMRTLCNEMESDLGLMYKKASRAYGTAGTTPFATAGDFTDAAQVRKVLADNGAPLGDLQLVIDTTAGASFRGKQSQIQMTGSNSLLNQGVLIDVHGMKIRESAQVKAHTKGTGASYLVNKSAGFAAADTDIDVDTGTGTVLAGDVLAFEDDTNKYVVGTALSGGTLSLNAPGLRKTLANNKTVTVGNSYTANMAFARSAIVLATRAPATPAEGDMAIDEYMLTDPISGLTFEVRVYPLERAIKIEIAIAWGVSCVAPEHCAILLG